MTQRQLLERRLIAGIERMGLSANMRQQELMLDLIALLARWSRAYNLTAVRDPLQMVPYHLLDSVAIARYLAGERILDMGTGAGFPGLPLAILRPTNTFVLLDSNGKKVRFVRQVVMELGLKNVEVVQSRIESYTCREKFATIVARAFASLPTILRLTQPLLDRPAVILAPKSRHVSAELDNLPVPSHALSLHRLQVPYLEGERMLVEIRFD